MSSTKNIFEPSLFLYICEKSQAFTRLSVRKLSCFFKAVFRTSSAVSIAPIHEFHLIAVAFFISHVKLRLKPKLKLHYAINYFGVQSTPAWLLATHTFWSREDLGARVLAWFVWQQAINVSHSFKLHIVGQSSDASAISISLSMAARNPNTLAARGFRRTRALAWLV